jgi:hypothetical protein
MKSGDVKQNGQLMVNNLCRETGSWNVFTKLVVVILICLHTKGVALKFTRDCLLCLA